MGDAILQDPVVIGWAAGLIVSHIVMHLAFSVGKSPLSVKPGVAAHQFACVVPFTYAAYRGTLLWLTDDIVAQQHGGRPIDRLYGGNALAADLARFMLGFQVYDLTSTAFVPELRKAEHILHHSATLLTAISAGAARGSDGVHVLPLGSGSPTA